MSENRSGFLRRTRVRMRLAWLIATAQRLAPFVGLGMVVIIGVDWLTPFDRGLEVSLLVFALFAAVLLVRAVSLRITPWDSARAAERGLAARDAFTTALEFADPEDGVHRIIQERANRLAARSRATDAIPFRAEPSSLRQFGMAAALALVIGLLPPLGSTPAMSAVSRTALEEEAAQLESIADAVIEVDVDTSDSISEELRRLAEELRSADSLEEALQSLEESETRLGEQVDPQFLSQKAAVQGLARDLALRPLVNGAPVDVTTQLEGLAGSLEGLSEPELAAIGDRLSDLSESQAAGNADLSSQLSEAARAIAEGDLTGAARSLQQAALDHETGFAGARGQQALSETQRALEGARARLSGSGIDQQAQGDDQSQGEGQGDGQGEGQEQGEGQGGGQGGEPGGGGGQITGVAPGDGNAQGQGGPGSVGAGTGQDHDSDVETAEVYSPIEEGALADLLQVGIDGGLGEGDIVSRGEGPTARGQSVVPYAQVLPEYLNQAADALDALQLPPSMRSIVQAYFDLLANEAR